MINAKTRLNIKGIELTVYTAAFEGKPDSESFARECLRDYMYMPELRIVFCRRGEFGKPYAKTEDAKGISMPFFNISHSGGRMVCAVSPCETGVDIEQVPRAASMDTEAVVRRFFAETERKYVFKAGSPEQSHIRFTEVWVRKEAFIKQDGRGLSYGLNRFSVSDGEKLLDAADGVDFADFHAGEGFCACAAVKSGETAAAILK